MTVNMVSDIKSNCAQIVRERIYNQNKFLLAPVANTCQERNKRKVFNDYFRYKAYMKNQEWFQDDLENIWSTKYIGLNPSSGFKKLEYQNPAYSAGFRLNRDPRLFSNAYTVQIAGCDYACLYCYVPYNINRDSYKNGGKLFTAKEIVDNFLVHRERVRFELNVLRISGGNPILVPEIIVDIIQEVSNRQLSDEIYIWIDSNLSTKKYMQNCEKDFIDAITNDNVGIVGCFKGINAFDFSKLTGRNKSDYKLQFETTEFLLETGCDLFLYLPAISYEDNLTDEIRKFAERIYLINPNLPRRLELLQIFDYPGSLANRSMWSKAGRHYPIDNQINFHKYWYNFLLPTIYTKQELGIYCAEVPLYK